MNKTIKELILWVLIIVPYIYLSFIWTQLPETIPTHFNIKGEPDDWSSKVTLLWMPGIIGLVIYLLMLFIPKLDPKNKITQMGEKYYKVRFILSFFIAVINLFIIYSSKAGDIKNNNFLFIIIGLFFALLGNYMQTFRPNYFVGIRTPWTLENEIVWKKTHRLGSRLWTIGGLLIAMLALFISESTVFMIVFTAIIAVISIIPIVYSYIFYQHEKNNIIKK